MDKMTHKTVEEYILSMTNARLDYPFGKDVAVYKVLIPSKGSVITGANGVQGSQKKPASGMDNTASAASTQLTQQSTASTGSVSGSARKQDSASRGEWKMFALIPEGKAPVRISLKCDPKLSEILRDKYETVSPGYHLNKKHWNTIILSGQLPWEEIQGLIRHSYELVTNSR